MKNFTCFLSLICCLSLPNVGSGMDHKKDIQISNFRSFNHEQTLESIYKILENESPYKELEDSKEFYKISNASYDKNWEEFFLQSQDVLGKSLKSSYPWGLLFFRMFHSNNDPYLS